MIRCNTLHLWKAAFACLLLTLGVSACKPVAAMVSWTGGEPAASFTPLKIATTTPTHAPAATSQVIERFPKATSQPDSIWLAESVPQRLRDLLKLPAGWITSSATASATAATSADAGLRLDVLTGHPTSLECVPWVYALVAPFPTIAEEVTLGDLRAAWKGAPPKNLPFSTLLVETATARVFDTLWGPASTVVQVKPAGQLVDIAWSAKATWAIIPFEQIEPRWKVIAVDGQSPVRKDFDLAKYGLAASFALQGDPAALEGFHAQGSLPESNRQANRLTTVVVTGVTALVRGTASLMEQRGMDYPAQDIGDWLREADILHISNEVAFAKTCPEPYNWEGLAFCSRSKYIKLLEDIGTDVVELSGDHFQDWGPEAVLYTMDLYQQEGWKTYAGGKNIEQALQPALFEHNGNKIAFIGCNAKPKGYATVSATTPGALHCDMDQMTASVKELRADGYQVIVTFQHLEYYSYTAHPILQKDFRQMADAGATIVSGSQAHQPHAFEFRDGALLHYGLGNLFFDQTNQGDPPRTAFIDRHIFYDGRYVGTELFTIYLVDYARSRPMTAEERQQMLTTVFQASGWK
jgi:poly-gamma-glutamate synthesis protein (capsule biosynthesis protein)